MATEKGTKENSCKLNTPPQTSEYVMYLDENDGMKVIVCVVGCTALLYDFRAIDDLNQMLRQHGDWIELGSADEQNPAKSETVEAWARSVSNPIGRWYGLKKESAAGSLCTCRHSLKHSVLLRSNTTCGITACVLN
jgi:hypothetical protein